MKTQPGYALPLTLAAIIVLALVAAIAAEQVQSSTRTITHLTDQMRVRISMTSAQQTLIYEMLTEPISMDGIAMGQASNPAAVLFGSGSASGEASTIKANGQAYRFGDTDPVIIRMYDDQTFLNALSSNPEALSDMLDLFDIPREQHDRLIATLMDYQDSDDLRSLGGAEARDYSTPGMPPNRPLRDALELCSVKYWSDTALCSDPARLLMTIRTRSSDQLSARLISEPLLRLFVPDASDADIRRLQMRYSDREFVSFRQIDAPEFDVTRDPLSIVSTAGPYLTIVTHTPDGVLTQRTVVEITPNNLFSPFVVHSNYAIGGDYPQMVLRIERIDDVPPLPQPAAINTQP